MGPFDGVILEVTTRKRKVGSTVKTNSEAGLLAVIGALLFFALVGCAGMHRTSPDQTTLNPPPGDEPILLVHGYMDTTYTPWWWALPEYLVEAGYPVETIHKINFAFVPLPGLAYQSPRTYAQTLEQRVQQIHYRTGRKVDIIAHSMGGLVARWYVEMLGGDRHVDDLVTLDTPHQGIYLAYLYYWSSGARDLVPGSEFMTVLNGTDLAEDVEYTAVWSGFDEFYLFNSNQKLPERYVQSPQARNVFGGYNPHLVSVLSPFAFSDYKQYLD